MALWAFPKIMLPVNFSTLDTTYYVWIAPLHVALCKHLNDLVYPAIPRVLNSFFMAWRCACGWCHADIKITAKRTRASVHAALQSTFAGWARGHCSSGMPRRTLCNQGWGVQECANPKTCVCLPLLHMQGRRYGFLTSYFGTYFIMRFRPDAYAVSNVVPCSAQNPSVPAILYCKLQQQLRSIIHAMGKCIF